MPAHTGGLGDDRLSGGAGSDHFDFSGGQDVILDFEDDRGVIVLQGSRLPATVEDAADLLALWRVRNGNVVTDFGGGDVLTILGLTSVQALADDCIVV